MTYRHPVLGLLCNSQHTTWNTNAQGKRLWDLFYSFNSFSIWLTFRQLAGHIRQSRSQATSSSTWQVDHFASILWFSTFRGILQYSSVLKLLDLLLVPCPVHEWLYWRQASSYFQFYCNFSHKMSQPLCSMHLYLFDYISASDFLL